ncbi:MAG TPA: ACT domain-containing protein, partial [Gemmatimonadaceae bacterium]|nr:ACT domain-containing protein [Gemmatimonadaceae bacterium]
LEIADGEGLQYSFEKTTISDEAHPNTVRITVARGPRRAVMVGSSLGAGRVLVTEIDGYPVDISGNFYSIVILAADVKGSIARVTHILSDHDINIATLKLTRKQRGGDAFIVIECDDNPGEEVRDEIRELAWVRWAMRLDRVSGG